MNIETDQERQICLTIGKSLHHLLLKSSMFGISGSGLGFIVSHKWDQDWNPRHSIIGLTTMPPQQLNDGHETKANILGPRYVHVYCLWRLCQFCPLTKTLNVCHEIKQYLKRCIGPFSASFSLSVQCNRQRHVPTAEHWSFKPQHDHNSWHICHNSWNPLRVPLKHAGNIFSLLKHQKAYFLVPLWPIL